MRGLIYLMKFRAMVKLLPVLFLLLLWAIPVPANEADNLPSLLNGWWMGKYKSWGGSNGVGYSERNLYLHISQNPLTGRFSLGTGGTWETAVAITGGKILIRIDREMREFILKKEDGHFLLEANYETDWPGWPIRNAIVLEKAN